MSIEASLLSLIVLLGFSAFFSSSETSLFSLTARQLARMRQERHPRVELIERLLSEPRSLIVTILIGNEFVNVSASVISAGLVIQLFGSDSKWLNLLVMVPLLLVFGEITPKTIAIRKNVAFASFQSAHLVRFARLIAPIRAAVRWVADRFITLLVGKERTRSSLITEDLVRSLAQEAVGDGALDQHEAQLIGRIFDFGDRQVRDLMMPRAGVFSLPLEMPVNEIVRKVRETRHSKIPIYQGTRDNVVGVLYARDLLGADLDSLTDDRALRSILRKAYFVPATRSATDLFHTFRRQKRSMALTIDEYGGITGLVTMEDLLECIFGEIHSESEARREVPIESLPDGKLRVPGATPINVLRSKLHTPLPETRAETVAGLALRAHGELPEPGTIISLGRIQLTVTRVEGTRIEELLLEVLPPAASSSPKGSS